MVTTLISIILIVLQRIEVIMSLSLNKKYLSMDEAAEYLGVKKSWLYKACMLGRVPFYKLGRFNRFLAHELDRYMAENCRQARI
jgi:excisionase family DNA binding protein